MLETGQAPVTFGPNLPLTLNPYRKHDVIPTTKPKLTPASILTLERTAMPALEPSVMLSLRLGCKPKPSVNPSANANPNPTPNPNVKVVCMSWLVPRAVHRKTYSSRTLPDPLSPYPLVCGRESCVWKCVRLCTFVYVLSC